MSFKMKRTLEMRRVESAFADYLENEDSIDLLWSDKVGYVFLTINEKTHQSESCEDLHTAPQLCRRLLDDMAITVMMQTKRNHNFTNMDKDEAVRVRAFWKPVIEKLPDYAYLCDEILREAQENEEENTNEEDRCTFDGFCYGSISGCLWWQRSKLGSYLCCSR